jgi:hypothetical protein
MEIQRESPLEMRSGDIAIGLNLFDGNSQPRVDRMLEVLEISFRAK